MTTMRSQIDVTRFWIIEFLCVGTFDGQIFVEINGEFDGKCTTAGTSFYRMIISIEKAEKSLRIEVPQLIRESFKDMSTGRRDLRKGGSIIENIKSGEEHEAYRRNEFDMRNRAQERTPRFYDIHQDCGFLDICQTIAIKEHFHEISRSSIIVYFRQRMEGGLRHEDTPVDRFTLKELLEKEQPGERAFLRVEIEPLEKFFVEDADEIAAYACEPKVV